MQRALWLLLLAACASNGGRVATFEREADEIRRTLHIPGMSAAIVQDQKVVWTHGFGYADLENKVPATPDTLYHIASVTKTFGSTLVMHLVETGQLRLDEPIAPYTPSTYSGTITDERVQIRHILSHTSAGMPGDQFAYDGNRGGGDEQMAERPGRACDEERDHARRGAPRDVRRRVPAQ